MTLDKVLSYKNVAGQPYLSDIENWLEIDLPVQKIGVIQKKLTELIRRGE